MMSAYRNIMKRGLLAAIIALVALPVLAIGVDKPLPDPALEARARALFVDFRCLVCQNQSIEDSQADLAKDLRLLVRERIQAGDSDEEVRVFLVDRYGDWVLLEPPFRVRTMILWLGPFAFLVVAGFIGWRMTRRTTTDTAVTGTDLKPAAKALSDEERKELDVMLKAQEGDQN